MQISELFKNEFEPELINEILKNSTQVLAKDGDIILDYGQLVRIMPIVLTGALKITRMNEDDNEIVLYYIQPGQTCAMTFTCCMQQFPSEIKATAEGDVTYLSVPVQQMDVWMNTYSTWKSYVMKTIRTRYNELLFVIDQIAFQKLDERLIYYLKKKSAATGSTLINLSHEQIATELATSRVVISRLLKQLENQKKVILYRNQIKLMKEL